MGVLGFGVEATALLAGAAVRGAGAGGARKGVRSVAQKGQAIQFVRMGRAQFLQGSRRSVLQ
jgi:hypothetical protein